MRKDSRHRYVSQITASVVRKNQARVFAIECCAYMCTTTVVFFVASRYNSPLAIETANAATNTGMIREEEAWIAMFSLKEA